MEREIVDKVIKNLKLRNIEGFYCKDFEEVSNKLMKMIPQSAVVGIGNSITLKEMDISQKLRNRGNIVYDKTIAKTRKESKELKKKSLLSEWYITGTNAISVDGHIVNMDHSGNRVAAMIYGPDNVVIIVGVNKIANSLEEAVYRVRNIASPRNAMRAGMKPPCINENRCVDCRSQDRVCNNLVVIEGQNERGRMKVFIVGQEAGF